MVSCLVIAHPIEDVAISGAAKVPHTKAPRSEVTTTALFDFVNELELTQNGRVRKAPLRERGMTGRTWVREMAAEVT